MSWHESECAIESCEETAIGELHNPRRELCLKHMTMHLPIEQLTDPAALDALKSRAEHTTHASPAYWVSQGFTRNWGDAAVMRWPDLEILRKETKDDDGLVLSVRYIVLSNTIPGCYIQLWAELRQDGILTSWGEF